MVRDFTERLKKVDELQDSVAVSSEIVDKLTQSVELLLQRQLKSETQAAAIDRTANSLQETMTALMTIIKDGLPSINDSPDQKNTMISTPIQVNSSPLEPGLTIPDTSLQGLASMMSNQESVLRKIDMPICDGKNPHGWIAQAERYFRISQCQDDEKLLLVSLRLEGDALRWYNEEMSSEAFTDWREFKTRLLARFSKIRKLSPPEVITESKSFLEKEAFTATELVQVKKNSGEKESITMSQFQEMISMSESDEEETDVIQDKMLKFDTSSLLASNSIPTLETKIIASNMAVTCVTKAQENSDFVNEDFLVVHDECRSLLLQPFHMDYMDSLVGMNSPHSLSIEFAGTVEKSQNLIVLTRLECAFQMLDSMSQQEGKIRSGMKRKCLKSWKFKFKTKSMFQAVKASKSQVPEHQQILSKRCWKYGFSVWHCWRHRRLQNHKLATLQLEIVATLTSTAKSHTDSAEFTDAATIAKSATSSRTIVEDKETILWSLLHDFARDVITEIQAGVELRGHSVWKEHTKEYIKLQIQFTSKWQFENIIMVKGLHVVGVSLAQTRHTVTTLLSVFRFTLLAIALLWLQVQPHENK